MTTNAFKLGLPTDIPWTRMCVSRDMIDTAICDSRFPPKWNSSLAVFRYMPPEEYQQYPDYDIAYLKVSVSITGYQPHDKEIEGVLDWSRMTTEEIEEVEDLLNEYQPCTGALVQVEVAPKEHERGEGIEHYPYFLDFEPKKRELFEMATDTNEKMSRSLQQLNVGKSATQTKSLEVLDVDMGGSRQFGMQSTYAGTGGGANGGDSWQGQWGTKDVSGNQSGTMITADNSNEKRETQSFTTQISQLYHLLDAYHVGTNRALFLLEPRPHVLESASGFVRGPRPIDGIQEFFLIVAVPKKEQDFCVSVRLDTAHLAEKEKMNYATRNDTMSLSASASPPEQNDPAAVFDGQETIGVWFGGKIGDRYYDCYAKRAEQTETYIAATHYADYKIDTGPTPPGPGPYTVTSSFSSHGNYSVDVSPDGETLTAKVWAVSRKCFNVGGTVCADCPPTMSARSANSSLDLIVHLKSREPIIPAGKEKFLLVTTRGLCCCDKPQPRSGILEAVPLDVVITRKGDQYGLVSDSVKRWIGAAQSASHATARGELFNQAVPEASSPSNADTGELTVKEANALGKLISRQLRSVSMSETKQEPTAYVLHDFFAERLEKRLRRYGTARRRLNTTVEAEQLPGDARALTKYFNRENVTRRDVASLSASELARVLKTDPQQVARVRLEALGVRLEPVAPADPIEVAKEQREEIEDLKDEISKLKKRKPQVKSEE